MNGERVRTVVALCALAGFVASGCASAPPEPEPREWTESRTAQAGSLEAALLEGAPAPGGEVVVRLAFGAEVDLDLYVTDPRQETVYFANTPSASGGVLESDQRCGPDAEGPRIEVIRFASPPAGRYRIGVDYPVSCDGRRDDTPFALAIEVDGVRRTLRGLARFIAFDVIVTEFEVGSGPASP